MNEYLRIPLVPSAKAWSTNQERRMDRYTRAARVRDWKKDARMAWRYQVPIEARESLKTESGYLPPSIVQVDIPFSQKRNRDPHNYCGTVVKAVIDGLVAEGLWPDDTPDWVGHRESLMVIGNHGMIRLYEQ